MNKVFAFIVFFISFQFVTTLQAQSPIAISAKAVLINDSSYILQSKVQIKEGWRVYGANPDGINAPSYATSLETVFFQDKVKFSIQPKSEKDILLGKATIFKEPFELEQPLIIRGFQPDSLQLRLVMNVAKADSFLSLEIPFAVALAKGKKVEGFQMLLPAEATGAPLNNCGNEAATSKSSSSPWELLILGFLGGLIALVTPCVFPMIPVTVSFFTKRSTSRQQGIKNGLLYGLSIFLIYIAASLPFHILGNVQPEIFNSISTNPWLNIIFFLIFIFFSISF